MSDEFHDPDPVPVLPVDDDEVDEPYPGAPVMPHSGQRSTVSHDVVDIYAEKRAAEEAELAATNQPAAEEVPDVA